MRGGPEGTKGYPPLIMQRIKTYSLVKAVLELTFRRISFGIRSRNYCL